MTFRLDGRVALVTGSSTGLGKAIAFALAEAGAKVAMNYANNEARARRTVEEFRALGYKGQMYRADVTDEAGVNRLVSDVARELGPVDVLVPNATCEQPLKPIEEYDWAFFQSMLDFFVKSPFLLTRACLPHMKAQRWGRIVNITSEVFQLGVAPFTAYVAAKGGQTGFSRSLARELAPMGITVNMVAPGWVPVERGIPTTRYAADLRWPGIAQAALGDGYDVIEEGLSGRTTDLPDDDPTVKELTGMGLDGSAYLPAAVASHLPLDLVVIMLGTNDLKAKFGRSPEAIAQGVRGLVQQVRRIDRGAWTEYPAPQVLVLAPPPLVQTERFPAAILAGGIDKSRVLASHLEAVTAATGAEFLDVGSITRADGVDGIHLSEAAHRKIGLAVADKIRAILE